MANHSPRRRGRMTLETLFTDPRFDDALLQQPQWSPDGAYLLYLAEAGADGMKTVWRLNAQTGERTPLMAPEDLQLPDESRTLHIGGYLASRDGRSLLLFESAPARFAPCGNLYHYDVGGRSLRPLTRTPAPQYHADFSPDGARAAVVRGNDLWLLDIAAGTERQLTYTGSHTLYNGRCGWVYEEELGLGRAWEWSPDGAHIVFLEQDETLVPEVALPRYDLPYLDPEVSRYPKAGAENPRTRLLVIDLASGEIRDLHFRSHDPEAGERYIVRLQWTPDGREILVQTVPRRQNRLFLHAIHPVTGAARVVLSEASSAWVDSRPAVRFVGETRQFLWLSDVSGWRHLSLVDMDTGEARQLTQGEWEVLDVAGTSAERREAYIVAAHPLPEHRSLLAVHLDTGAMQMLAGPGGSHTGHFAPTGHHYLHTHSSLEEPPSQHIRSVDSAAAGCTFSVGTPRANPLREAGLETVGPWKIFWLETEGGRRLRARMLLPPRLRTERRHPALIYTYGGPGSQVVVDAWAGKRDLWHRWLAQQGYVVLMVDNRGTGGRGRDFLTRPAGCLGLLEVDDQIAAARYLQAQPYVHPERIGIWGWSYGGYMAVMCMLAEASVFRAAAAVAPVTDWTLYDTIYTERYMLQPEENPAGYRQGSPVHHASLLRGKLLLVHGLNDDNVHFQHTAQLASALQDAGKPFEVMIYPGKRHGIEGRHAHLYALLTEFFRRSLKR